MDITLRTALRRTQRLRNQIENMLLGEDSDTVEAELKKFASKRPCWVKPDKSARPKAFIDFFRTRDSLWISDDFRSRVLALASETEAVGVKHFDLKRDMIDSEIEAELGERHIWSEGELCATIMKMIESQWGGKERELLNNGYANLFYTSSCVVSVRWSAFYGEWHVRAWDRADRRWLAGGRAFSRN